ncbi:hypothetical protein M0R45_025846 [Rubus argutus]|uniref:Uncharacterized protein n=1 Tax=Rubus argutus TaxID=59490 RepID=A0AAW1WYB9_RUBAR
MSIPVATPPNPSSATIKIQRQRFSHAHHHITASLPPPRSISSHRRDSLPSITDAPHHFRCRLPHVPLSAKKKE